MHQPLYRLRGETSCFMPWVRLHAIRSYYDMIRVLEEFPDVRVTVNVVPILLEQIAAYTGGGRDLFWDVGAVPAEDLDEGQRSFLIEQFFSARSESMIADLPRFAELLGKRERARIVRGPAEAWKEFGTSDYRDLQLLFDLSWFGFKAREDFPELQALRRRGQGFTQENLRTVHEIETAILMRLPALYRDAAAQGRAEIATSPYAHPILPLLVDSDVAREGRGDLPLPARFRFPGDARAQLGEGLAAVERFLGVRPKGLWPSEGGVSREAISLAAEEGFAWAASDEEVLLRSERDGPADPTRPWRLEGPDGGPTLVFRDHDLSDRIGFTYAGAPPAAAAAGFLGEVVRRARRTDGADGMVLVALDGENPWESYPRAGADFLRALYGAVALSREVAAVPVSEAIAKAERSGTIKRLHAGSWIRADFSTWIGAPEKNRAWGLLGRARADLDAALVDEKAPAEGRRDGWASLRAAEGSDWFWWLDDQFASAHRAEFDRLFRGHLREAYEALGRPAPDELGWPVRSPGKDLGAAAIFSGPVDWLRVTIDGYEGDYFEWQGATMLASSALHASGAMQRAGRTVASLRFGFTRGGEIVLRLDPDPQTPLPVWADLGLDLSFHGGGETRQISVDLDERGVARPARLYLAVPQEGTAALSPRPSRANVAAGKILEISVPAEEAGLRAGRRAGLRVRLRSREETVSLREIDLTTPEFPAHAPAEETT